MNFLKTQGIILNRMNYGDADLILTIFTRDNGKITCMARGSRKITSKRLGRLEPYSHISFELVQNGERNTLTHVELISDYSLNKKELFNISRIYQIGELLNSLLPENEPHVEVYDLTLKALDNLLKFETPEYLRRFKRSLLQKLGYGLLDKSEETLDRYIESLLEKPLKVKKIL